MATVRDLIQSALVRIGVQNPREEVKPGDATTALAALNALLDQWRTSRLMVTSWDSLTFNLTTGQAEYTIGPGGNFATTPRPPMLDDYAFVTVDGFDHPIRMVSGAEYSRIYWKGMSAGWPEAMYLDDAYPLATLSFWPAPGGPYTVTLRVPTALGPYTSLNETFTAGPGVERALSLSLAEDLAPSYGVEFTMQQMRQAKSARDSIRRLNVVVPILSAFQPETI